MGNGAWQATHRSRNKQLEKWLGKKGQPKSILDSMTNSNPNYYQSVKNRDKKYTKNCQRCIYAYEMRRRGYDVEAKPAITDKYDPLPYANSYQGWTKVMDGLEEVKMPSRNTIMSMLNQMTDWGDGARAIVRVSWKNRNFGHVFIAEQVGDGTEFIDPQTGSSVDIHEYMDRAIKGRTTLSRIDNLEPNSLIQACVKKK